MKCQVNCGVSQNITPKLPVIQESAPKKKNHYGDKSLNWYLGWK